MQFISYSVESSGQNVAPQFQVVKVGDPIIIKCNSESLPEWHRYGIPVKSVRKGKVVIASAIEDDTGTFTCQGTKIENGTLIVFKAQADVMVGGMYSVFLLECIQAINFKYYAENFNLKFKG